MSAHIRQLLTALGLGSGTVAAFLSAPGATAQPSGGTLPSNCLPGIHGQLVYCDEDINPDGSWVRCVQPKPTSITVFGGVGGYLPEVPPDCGLVKPNTLPAGSPPYHIGYGGEATGRV
ncbi:CDGP domain-containing protein [[Mycobacterium] vasticus]|uniref:CDGP domain-containing protein n=1 Tax=[Mycobacterium] vasticus TaxID=2875777 RepID=A0ABU5Z0S2_9MYCO|nr:hypothetical protein [Mycolicibacter sp. MYC017]MEB3071002.1 hypothetical protein [Mycolicibacter sp. MYC017]